VAEKRVVVVGGGVAGLFTAWDLVRAGGVQVDVLEMSHPGDGSSGRSVGMVETQYFDAADVAVRAYGREVYSRLETNEGLTFTHGGYLRLGRTDADLELFGASIETQRAAGVDDAVVLTRAELGERWGHLVTDDLSGGLFGAWDGYVDGYEVCQVLARLVRAAGGRVHTSTRLLGAERPGAWRLETTAGVFEADVVVNAAGSWAGRVGDLLGAPIALTPQLHGAVTVELAHDVPFTPFIMDYMPGSGVEGVYFRSERPDQLIAGLHTEEAISPTVDPDTALGSLPMAEVERIIELLLPRLHNVDDMAIGRSWTGTYPMTSTLAPITGPHPDQPSVVYAAGGGGNGIQLGPAIARHAADAILERPSAFAQHALDWQVTAGAVI
jgi:sarcosine oxidase subunit beta